MQDPKEDEIFVEPDTESDDYLDELDYDPYEGRIVDWDGLDEIY